jgi:hypothetical protein
MSSDLQREKAGRYSGDKGNPVYFSYRLLKKKGYGNFKHP